MEKIECIGCNKKLPREGFHKDKTRKSGIRERCKSCRCKHPVGNLEKNCVACGDVFLTKEKGKAQKYCGLVCQKVHIRYGISEYDLEDLLISSDYKCTICGCEEKNTDKRTGKVFSLSIDHCHKTGKVRGVLCSSCNAGLGYFKDNIDNLKKAIKYLTKECPSFDAKKEYADII
jgi:hypothetical protein